MATGPLDDVPPGDGIFTVSRLNREARSLLETGFSAVRVEGELSNLARPGSGHIYFTLKDQTAQLRCAMFRQNNLRLAFRPADGHAVICRGRLSIYEARGDYQLIVETMEPEGLFDPGHKQMIPALPHRVGVITSPTGAALRDILHVLARRFPAVPVRIYPVPVQGDGAGEKIAAALTLAGRRRDCDVLILARGGGSLEDLWAFNEEKLARAIYACPIPILTGVGHEIDFTIADFVADQRAPTPSGAAELAVPDSAEWLRRYNLVESLLRAMVGRRLDDLGRRLEWQSARLNRLHPGNRLRQQAQRLDELEQRLGAACRGRVRQLSTELATLAAGLRGVSPLPRLRTARERVRALDDRIRLAMRHRLERSRRQLESLANTLRAVGPEATLARGYAIVTLPDGAIVRSPAQVAPEQEIGIRVAAGRFAARVTDRDQERS
jgi:exodeoxyribonuclease VII large subunit